MQLTLLLRDRGITREYRVIEDLELALHFFVHPLVDTHSLPQTLTTHFGGLFVEPGDLVNLPLMQVQKPDLFRNVLVDLFLGCTFCGLLISDLSHEPRQ